MWSLTKTQRNSLKITYYKMLQNILNIKSKDKVRLTEIHKESEGRDIEWVIKKLKLSYAEHLVREKDKWNKFVEEYSLRYWKRNRGSPPRRCRDELVKEFGVLRGRARRDRVRWRPMPVSGWIVGTVTACTSCSRLYVTRIQRL